MQALNGEQQLHSAIGSQGQTLNIAGEEMAEEIGLEEMVMFTVKFLYI